MTLVYFLIVIGVLIFVHELGHFIMAKRGGVRVEKFSLGMGPRVLGVKKGETEYLISALPLGGYVKMAGENPDEETTGAPDEFTSKTVWQRAKIVATGPLTNILLAFIVMPFVFMIGTPAEGPARIGYVEKGSPAEEAGFMAGDVIEKINNRYITSWEKALMLIAMNPDSDVTVLISRGGEKRTLTLRPTMATDLKIGSAGILPDMPVEFGRIAPGMPAEKAGIKANDKVIAVDGKAVYHWVQFAGLVNDSDGRPIILTIEREGRRMTKAITPIQMEGRFRIGVEPLRHLEIRRYGVIESIQLGVSKAVEAIDFTFITLKKLLTFNLSIKTLGGPVMIAQMSGEAAKMGLSAFLNLLAVVSISLGILNLLPIPVLDGGMLLFLAVEAIRRRPLSRKTMEIAQAAGATVLIILIAIVSYNDVMRLLFSKP